MFYIFALNFFFTLQPTTSSRSGSHPTTSKVRNRNQGVILSIGLVYYDSKLIIYPSPTYQSTKKPTRKPTRKVSTYLLLCSLSLIDIEICMVPELSRERKASGQLIL